jgi:glycosyltransferase involved in cell wall biosynthesis
VSGVCANKMTNDAAVTVLLSTRNRAHALPATVQALVRSCRAAPFSTEILVIDNGSNDSTPELLSDMARRYPELRVVRDEIPGKSGACNRGLGKARGQAVIFTDDDVHVPDSWIADMAGPILRGEADGVAGRLELAPHLARSWLTPKLRASFAELLDVGGEFPGTVGANMATSRVAARAIGFDEELGPGARGFADDVLFNFRLKAAGYRLVGAAGPPAVHHFDEDRLEYRRLADLARRNGSSHAYLWHHWLHSGLRFTRVRLLRNEIRLALFRSLHRRRLDRIDVTEYEYIEAVAFCRHLLIERRRPPNY